MPRIWKQLAFGSLYLAIIVLIAGGIYFFYLGPAPSCTDNKQNQGEVGIDCGGNCLPCEVKNLSPITEELKIFPAGQNQVTLLAKVRNPSQNFSANFSYQFELGGTLPTRSRELRGKTSLAPQAIKYIIVPGLPIGAENLRGVNLGVSDLNWSEEKLPVSDIQVNSGSSIDKTRVKVIGVLSNGSAVNLPLVDLAAILFDKEGKILNASITRLEKVEAFSQRQFTIFFPEVEGLAESLDPQRTEIQWELNDKSP